MKKFFKQKNNGFTLVETLVAISIFTMSILGLMSVLASGISNTTYAKQKMVASYLAQEGIEHARNIRDNHVLYDTSSGWNNFKNDTNVTNYPSPNDYSSFIRTITISTVRTNEVKIISKVEWKQGSGTYNITFLENLFNWVE